MSGLERLPRELAASLARHVRLLRAVGVALLGGARRRRLALFAALLAPMLAGQLLHVARARDLLLLANALPTTLMTSQDTVKMIVVLYKRKEIKRVILGLAESWPTEIPSQENKRNFKRTLRRLKTLDDMFFACSAAFLALYEAAPLAGTLAEALRGRARLRYPLQCYPLTEITSPWLYAVAYCYLVVTSVTTHMVLYISTDFLLITLTVNLSALLVLLQRDLEEAVAGYRHDDQLTVDAVKDIVVRHQKLLWLAAQLNSIFGVLVLVQLSFSSVVICCFGFLTAVAKGLSLNNLVAALGVVFAIGNLCWPGQLLADTSGGVAAAAYGSAWSGAHAALRPYVLIIMRRAQKPCYLTALGFSNLQLANFAKVLSTSWSYLSLLNQMYRDSDA